MPRLGNKRVDPSNSRRKPGRTRIYPRKSFVMRKGDVKKGMKTLVRNLREVFYPYTGMNIQDSNYVKVKDIKRSCAMFGINTLITLTSSEKNNFVKFTKMGKGPTFTFKIMRYSTNADIHMLLPRAKRLSAKNLGSPLVILNGFGVKSDSKETTKDGVTEFTTGPQERQITSTMFNNLFPGLNLGRVKHSTLKRVVLVNYDAERDLVEVRHYYIRQNHTDMNNKIKKMVNNKKLPNLGDCKDLSQYFTGNVGYVSESDIDMLPNSKINVEEENNKGKVTKRKVNLRLFEIGPRMTLKLVKIEEGFMGGEIFYHRYRKKTHREKKEQKSLIEQKLKMKEDRKKTQEANVAAKEEKMQELQDKLNKRVVRDKRFELLGKRDPADLEKGLEEIDKVEYEEGMVPDEELVEHNENDDDVDYVDDDQDPDGDHHGNDNEDEDSVGDGEHAGEPDSEEEEGEELGDFDNYETNFV